MASIRDLAKLVRWTPLHPQWLLGQRRVPTGIASATGIVLDIGAADRWITPHLSRDTTYVALDYPATGNEFYDARPDVFGDASRLPFGDSSVDNVVCLEVIEHLRDPASALSEIRRVLKPDGRAWISIPFMYPIHNEPYDFQRFTEYGLRREAARARLEILDLEHSGQAVRAAGLMMCLALAGGVNEAHPLAKILLLPLALSGILVVNSAAWLASLFWPDWKNLATNYHLVLRIADATAISHAGPPQCETSANPDSGTH